MNISKNHKNQQKKCTKCGIVLDDTNANQYNIDHGKYVCILCLKQINQIKYLEHRDHIRKRQMEYEKKLKIETMNEYGNKCVCCEETQLEFLTIDHINNDGAVLRKKLKQGTGAKLYRWLKKNSYPKDSYQILCFNCNLAKSFCGYCPHQLELSRHEGIESVSV